MEYKFEGTVQVSPSVLASDVEKAIKKAIEYLGVTYELPSHKNKIWLGVRVFHESTTEFQKQLRSEHDDA